MERFFPYVNTEFHAAIVFVNGENLAIQYGNMLKSQKLTRQSHIHYVPNVFVRFSHLNNTCTLVASYYQRYTYSKPLTLKSYKVPMFIII